MRMPHFVLLDVLIFIKDDSVEELSFVLNGLFTLVALFCMQNFLVLPVLVGERYLWRPHLWL
jgi:hypothetical protein